MSTGSRRARIGHAMLWPPVGPMVPADPPQLGILDLTIVLLFLGLAFAVAFLPQMWIKSVIRQHADERADFAGTGGEFARHVLDGMGLHHVVVEETQLGDHYDPDAKAVRLLPQHFGKRSLSAVVIAAHEVGHAMQDATGYKPLVARTQLARRAQYVEKFGSVVMLAAPVMMLLSKSPHRVQRRKPCHGFGQRAAPRMDRVRGRNDRGDPAAAGNPALRMLLGGSGIGIETGKADHGRRKQAARARSKGDVPPGCAPVKECAASPHAALVVPGCRQAHAGSRVVLVPGAGPGWNLSPILGQNVVSESSMRRQYKRV